MKRLRGEAALLALSIQRIPFLRPEEKLLLWDLVDDELSLSLLLRRDVEAAIGREPGRRAWVPDSSSRPPSATPASWRTRAAASSTSTTRTTRPRCGRPRGPPSASSRRGSDASTPELGRGRRDRRHAGSRRDGDWRPPSTSLAGYRPRALRSSRGLRGASTRRRIAGPSRADAGRRAGATCAVLPCGIDRVYPPGNRPSPRRSSTPAGSCSPSIRPERRSGNTASPSGTGSSRGCARACVVVEAPAKSGALITADHALDEGRDVWVVADCLGGPRSAGIDASPRRGRSGRERRGHPGRLGPRPARGESRLAARREQRSGRRASCLGEATWHAARDEVATGERADGRAR